MSENQETVEDFQNVEKTEKTEETEEIEQSEQTENAIDSNNAEEATDNGSNDNHTSEQDVFKTETVLETENFNNDSKVDEDDDSRKLFVGGLSWETTEEDMKSYFETWGRVTSCSIKIDKMTGNSRGFGFVTMESEDCMRKVLSAGEHRLKNKKIDPKAAKPTKEPIKKIFVGGLPSEVSEEQIKEYFSQYGTVETVDLPFDTQKGKRKPYVFLSFSTEDAAKNAIATEKQDVCGSKCDVRMAVPKDQVNKNKMTTWGPYGAGGYPGGADYYSYEYPYGGPYSYDYSGYYSGYPYGYSYPMPPQPYVAPHRGALSGGKMNTRGRGNPNFHPYARPQ